MIVVPVWGFVGVHLEYLNCLFFKFYAYAIKINLFYFSGTLKIAEVVSRFKDLNFEDFLQAWINIFQCSENFFRILFGNEFLGSSIYVLTFSKIGIK